MFSHPFDSKALAREKAKKVRQDLFEKHPAGGRHVARHAARHFMDAIPVGAGQIVALYHPIGTELDTGPLGAALHEKAVTLALPVIQRKKAPLIFRLMDGSALVEGPFGIMEPPQTAPQVTPDIIVVPLLAFNRQGHRLGMGGGYYDRTLSSPECHSMNVGFAYGGQEENALPVNKHDHALDWVVTERGAIKCS